MTLSLSDNSMSEMVGRVNGAKDLPKLQFAN
jgi:hypothetical protein